MILSDILSTNLNVRPGSVSEILNGKNPNCILNEIFSTLMYEVESVSGPAHDPVFVLSLKIKNLNQKFTGSGSSKKLARNNAALNALHCLFNCPKNSEDDADTVSNDSGISLVSPIPSIKLDSTETENEGKIKTRNMGLINVLSNLG